MTNVVAIDLSSDLHLHWLLLYVLPKTGLSALLHQVGDSCNLTSSPTLLHLPFDSLTYIEDELSNKNKAYLSSSFSYWGMDFQSLWTFEQSNIESTGDFLVPFEMFSVYPFLCSLKLFYIDICSNHQIKVSRRLVMLAWLDSLDRKVYSVVCVGMMVTLCEEGSPILLVFEFNVANGLAA